MRKYLTAAALGLSLAGAAAAQGYGYSDYGHDRPDYRGNSTYSVDHCAKQKRDGRTSGAIVGGLIGAVAGGAIGNNIDNDDRHYRRGYRGHRGYYGYRGYGRRHHKNSNSGNVAAGAVIGGLLGAVAGSEVGKNNVNCRTYHDSIPSRGYRGYQGDPSIAPPTRQPWPEQTRSYPVSQPSSDNRAIRSYPAPAQRPQANWPEYESDDLYGGREPCETLTRVTRLPDGREIREQVQNCNQGEVYYERNGRRLESGF